MVLFRLFCSRNTNTIVTLICNCIDLLLGLSVPEIMKMLLTMAKL